LNGAPSVNDYQTRLLLYAHSNSQLLRVRVRVNLTLKLFRVFPGVCALQILWKFVPDCRTTHAEAAAISPRHLEPLVRVTDTLRCADNDRVLVTVKLSSPQLSVSESSRLLCHVVWNCLTILSAQTLSSVLLKYCFQQTSRDVVCGLLCVFIICDTKA